MNHKTAKTKSGFVIGLLGVTMIVSLGILRLPLASAQDAFIKVYDQAEKDCEKIAERFGKSVPGSLAIGGRGIDTYSVGCGFKSEGSLQVEDILIVIDSFGLSRYSTPEAARNSVRNSVKVYPLEHKTNTANSDIVATMKESSDGSVYLLKSYLVSVWPEFRKTHTAKVTIVRGSCVVSVTSYSSLNDPVGYHVSDPQTRDKLLNKHPEFNHDREADMLVLARKKAEEVFGVLDCGDSAPVQPATNVPVETILVPPLENLPEVEALVEKTPTENDLQLPPDEKPSPSIRVAELDGLAEFQLPNGTWIPVEGGDTLPSEGTLQTQYGSTAKLYFSNNIIIFVGPLSEFNVKEFNLDPKSYRTRLDLGAGEVRFKVLEGDFETDMQVSPPNSTASPAGTDFAVSHDKNTGLTIYEIYDGSLLITSTLTEKQKTIFSSYGEPIRRIEIAKGGAMTEQIAISKDEWQARQTKQQEKSNNGARWLTLVLVLAGGVFILHKTGKLQPILQKVSALVQKNNSKSL